jgi:hypothetical protein
MGDSNEWDFNGFRNQPFKSSLDKKSGHDYPGEDGVVEFIFRTYFDDDNRVKTGMRDWHDAQVYHMKVIWGYGHVEAWIDGDQIANEDYGVEYAPPNHRIALGCPPRTETLVGAIWSNVKIAPR